MRPNNSSKPVPLRGAALLRCEYHHPLYARSHLFQHPALLQSFPILFGLQRLCSKCHQLAFLQRRAAFMARRFCVGCALVHVRALPFGLRV